MNLTDEEEEKFENATTCHICKDPFTDEFDTDDTFTDENETEEKGKGA